MLAVIECLLHSQLWLSSVVAEELAPLGSLSSDADNRPRSVSFLLLPRSSRYSRTTLKLARADRSRHLMSPSHDTLTSLSCW